MIGVLEKLLHMSALFDFYGPLLTDKQRRCLQMHLFEDFSLSEISQELGISRQAVYDMLRRSEQLMQQYEDRLHLVARAQEQQVLLERLRADLTDFKQSFAQKSAKENEDTLNDIMGLVSMLIK